MGEFWGDAEVNLDAVQDRASKEVEPRAKELSDLEAAGMPNELTIGWVDRQLPTAVWRENKTALNPAMIVLMCKYARKGMSKRAIMARIGMHVNSWTVWERQAAQGNQPYALWYQCVMHSASGIEEELLDRVRRHAIEDWKAASWLLNKLNPDEFSENKNPTTTVNINNDGIEAKVQVNRLDDNTTKKIAELYMAHVQPEPAAIEGEVVEETDAG